MKTMEFVSYLQNLGVKLWIDGEQLRYRSPKGVITPELKQSIVERKADILKLLKKAQKNRQSDAASSIQPISREQVIPLSHAQQRLWFIEKMGLSRNAYNIPTILHLVGQLDEVALEKSLNQIITRHEILRTTFEKINGIPVQVIKPPFELELPKTDLSQLAPSEQTTQLEQLILRENEKLFNLEVGIP
ncbi:MAG: non-ribosomal peptide synthetase, partial [Okeania sp. SIO2D1]|nr:non-ribosomal peptide synthetase [Okeania sp. SIO2D1]